MPEDPARSEGALVEATGLSAGYEGQEVITGASFGLRRGQRLALLGPNGGGKTTLLRAILGELEPLRGELAVSARCGTVPQSSQARLDYPVSALDVALMGTLNHLRWWQRPGQTERDEARTALARVGLADLTQETFGALSAGQRQRVLVARGLVQDAELILLDEPFAGIDRRSAFQLEDLISSLAEEGRAVIIATHDLEQARRWDLVLCMNRRQVAFGKPDEVLSRDVLEETYGGEIVELPGGRTGVVPPHHHEAH